MTCNKCGQQVHWCSSCGLSESEAAPYENGVCDSCFTDSGARKIYDECIEIQQYELREAQIKIDDLLANYIKDSNAKP